MSPSRCLVRDPTDLYLLSLCRQFIGAQPIAGASPRAVGWGQLLEAARAHQVAPIVYTTLNETKHHAPDGSMEVLRREFHATGARNDFIRARLSEVLGHVGARGMDVILLKGAALAFETYPSPSLRPMDDVDLLVREEQFGLFRDVLERAGYRTDVPTVRPSDLPLFAHTVGQVRFASDIPPRIEVHFRLPNTGIPASTERAWTDARDASLFGTPVRTLSDERMLLHLCLHAQQHRFAVLRLLVDIATWVRVRAPNANRLEELARELHLSTTVHYALTYTGELLDQWAYEGVRARTQPSWGRDAVLRCLWSDARVRSLRARPWRREFELPGQYVFGDAPGHRKAAFLWHVLLPSERWGAGREGPLQRILRRGPNAARRLGPTTT